MVRVDKLAELVTADAAVVLHYVEIVGQFYVLRRLFAAEYAGLGDLHHRIPVDRRVVVRSGGLARRSHGLQIELLAGRAFYLGRIDEAVTAYPNVVVGFGQIGNNVAPLIVGDDNADKAHRQIARFRDNPHAGFRPLRPGNDAADIVVIDGNRGCRLRLHRSGCDPTQHCNT